MIPIKSYESCNTFSKPNDFENNLEMIAETRSDDVLGVVDVVFVY